MAHAPGTAISRTYRGIPIVIDRPIGFVQTGERADGTAWSRTYSANYGYILAATEAPMSTDGGDDEELDVFIGDDDAAPLAFWAEQTRADGTFDEFKVFLGYATLAEAEAVYASHIPLEYLRGWTVTSVDLILALLGIAPGKSSNTTPTPENIMSKATTTVKKDDELLDELDAGPPGTQSIPGAGDVLKIAASRLNTLARSVSADGTITAAQMADLAGIKALIGVVAPSGDPAFKAIQMSVANTASLAQKASDAGNEALRKAYLDQMAKAITLTDTIFSAPSGPTGGAQVLPVQQVNDPDQRKPQSLATLTPSTPGGETIFSSNGAIQSGAASGGGDPGNTEISVPAPSTDSGDFIASSNGVLKNLAGAVAKLRAKASGAAAPAAAPVAKQDMNVPTPAETDGAWSVAYVNQLPDSSFLYAEPNVADNLKKAGMNTRHFPVRDLGGNLSKAAIQKAIATIPQSGFPAAMKANLLAKAEELLEEADKDKESDLTTKARGDDGWHDDMSSDAARAGRKARNAGRFGYDNLAQKAKTAPAPHRR